MKKIRQAIVAVCVLAVVLTGGWLAFGETFLKSLLVRAVYHHTGRTLEIEGEFRVSLSAWALEADGVRLSAPGDPSQVFIQLGSIRFSPEFWSLFKGELGIDYLHIMDVHAQLIRFADGRTNFDDLLPGPSSSSGAGVRIGMLEFTSFSITWQDELTGHTLQLHQLNGMLGPWHPQADGHVKLQGMLTAELDSLTFELESGYKVSSADQEILAEGIRLKVKADSKIPSAVHREIPAIQALLEAPRLTLKFSDFGFTLPEIRLQLDYAGPRPVSSIQAPPAPNILEDFQAPAGLPGAKSVLARFTDRFPGSGMSYLQLQNVRLAAEKLNAEVFKLGWRTDLPEMLLQGELAGAFQYDLSTSECKIAGIRGELGVDWSEFLIKPLKLEVDAQLMADLNRHQWQGSSVFRSEGTRFDLDWDLSTAPGFRLNFSGNLNRLNLDEYLQRRKASGTVANRQEIRARLREAAAVSGVTVEIQGRLRIADLWFRQIQMLNLESELVLQEGQLDIRIGDPDRQGEAGPRQTQTPGISDQKP